MVSFNERVAKVLELVYMERIIPIGDCLPVVTLKTLKARSISMYYSSAEY